MKLFNGISRTDYQDLFRAIGLMLDDKGLRDIRIWEHADGLIVQGCRAGESTFESTLLTDEDLSELLVESYGRRSQESA